jgi:3-oxoadipate enol-lactonase
MTQIDPGSYATARDGCRLFYRFDGAPAGAPVLVLAHALGASHAMWDAQLALAPELRLLRYDSRGHGRSDVPAGPYTVEMLAADVVAVLDHAAIERAAFCGLSMGGMVGQALGRLHGERLERLVLANTAAVMGPPESWDARIELARTGGMVALRDTVLERWFTPEFRRGDPAAVARIGALFEATSVTGYVGCCAAIRTMDQRATLADITAPTMVLVGSHDPSTPPELGEFIAAAVPGARLVRIDAAHLSNVERPAEFSAAVREFVLV